MAKINPIMQSIREATPPEIRRQVDLSVHTSSKLTVSPYSYDISEPPINNIADDSDI